MNINILKIIKISLLFTFCLLILMNFFMSNGFSFTNSYSKENHQNNFLDKSIYELSKEDLKILKIKFDISKKYIFDLKNTGFLKIQVDDIILLRKYNTTIVYINEIKKMGPSHLSIDEIAIMSKYGVTGKYINKIRKQSSRNFSMDEITSMAKNGIQPDLLKKLREIGYQNIEIYNLLSIVKHKISFEFLKAVFNSSNKCKVELIKILIRIGFIDDSSDFDYNRAIREKKIDLIKLDQVIKLWETGIGLKDIKKLNQK